MKSRRVVEQGFRRDPEHIPLVTMGAVSSACFGMGGFLQTKGFDTANGSVHMGLDDGPAHEEDDYTVHRQRRPLKMGGTR